MKTLYVLAFKLKRFSFYSLQNFVVPVKLSRVEKKYPNGFPFYK